MLSIEHKMNFMLVGGFTKRFHTIPTLREHTVGHHSFGVACFAWLLAGERCSAALLMSALTHDLAEQHVGDIPSPTKRAMPSLKHDLDCYEYSFLENAGLEFDLSIENQRILKIADIFDGMWNCVVERRLGNQIIAVAYYNFKSYAAAMNLKGLELQLYVHLSNLWEQANGRK